MKTLLVCLALLLATGPCMAQNKDSILAAVSSLDLRNFQYKIVTKKRKPMKLKVYPREVVLQYLTSANLHTNLAELHIPMKGKDKIKLTDEAIAKLKKFREKMSQIRTNMLIDQYAAPIKGKEFLEGIGQSTGAIEDYVAPIQGKDPFAQFFYPPELIMQYKGKIGLSEQQEEVLRRLVDDATQSFNELNWELKSTTQELLDIIAEPRVDLAKAQGQLTKVLALEEQVKMLQLQVMITIKNQLTQQQQQQLDGYKQ